MSSERLIRIIEKNVEFEQTSPYNFCDPTEILRRLAKTFPREHGAISELIVLLQDILSGIEIMEKSL